MTDLSRNTLWAGAFIDELARGGVTDLCLAPGSRSAPLVLAAARSGHLRLRVHLDERSAAFFALGMGKASGRPAAVVTTSGTAAANLLPAVVEASQAETPLLVLTADRPHHLRDSDANQAIDQLRLFGGYVREFFEVAPPVVGGLELRHLRALAARAVAAAVGLPAGPVHLNFPLDKPLEPVAGTGDVPPGFAASHPRAFGGREQGAPFVRITPRRPLAVASEIDALAALVRGAARGVVVAGPSPDPRRLGEAALRLGAATGFPVLADPLSGARLRPSSGAAVMGAYDWVLRDPAARARLAPDLVLRVGQSPTSAALLRWLEEHAGARQVVIDAGRRWKDHLAVATDYVQADAADTLDRLAARVRGDGRGADDRPGEDRLTHHRQTQQGSAHERLPHDSDAPEPGTPEPGTPDPGTAERLTDRIGPWTRLWMRLDQRAREVAAAHARDAFFEGSVLAEVAGAVPDGGTLFVSSSMPVRDLDAFGAPREARVLVLGNRGASGIDGIVSTALGASAGGAGSDGGGPTSVPSGGGPPTGGGAADGPSGAGRSGSGATGAGSIDARSGDGPPTVAVLGDIALLHDGGGLLATRERDARVVFVVIHNDGGGIFHLLPIREHEPEFTPYFATPHGLDLSHLAALYRLPYTRAGDRGALGAALAGALAAGGSHVIAVPSDREENRQHRMAVEGAVRSALQEILAEADGE